MKFFAFVKKELRETVFPSLIFFLIASLVIFFILANQHMSRYHFPDSHSFGKYQGYHEYPISYELLITLMIFNAWAATGISVMQFWLPWLTKTWAFHLQRASKRTGIFWAKCIVGILCVTLPSIILWTAAFLYIRYHFPVPLGLDIWSEGLLPLGWGGIFYFATALSSLLPARLYTTRFFPLPIALLVLFWGLITMSFSSVVVYPTIISILLICQIIDEIRVREF